MTERLDTSPASIARAAACLRAGGLVAFPTETVYGLGASALDAAAVRRLFQAKGRPPDDPLIVHAASFEEIADLLGDELETGPYSRARRLAARFWPGPLTLVLPKSTRVPSEVTAGLDTVAVRVPAHSAALALLEAACIPIAAPSANLFSRPSPTRAEHVLQDLEGRIDMLIDGGATHVGVESTVLDLTRGEPIVLRPGAVTVEMLKQHLPVVRVRDPRRAESGPYAAPGMMPRHYSPRAPLTLFAGPSEAALQALAARAQDEASQGRRVGALVMREDVEAFGDFPVRVAEMGSERDLAGVATRLYEALRQLDDAGVDLILARDVPGEEGLGLALRDRLRRAAAERVEVS